MRAFFLNGARQETISRASIPMNINGSTGQVSFNVLDARSPALLGMEFLKSSKAVIDYDLETVRFKELAPEPIPLKCLDSGHLAIRLAGNDTGATSHSGSPQRPSNEVAGRAAGG